MKWCHDAKITLLKHSTLFHSKTWTRHVLTVCVMWLTFWDIVCLFFKGSLETLAQHFNSADLHTVTHGWTQPWWPTHGRYCEFGFPQCSHYFDLICVNAKCWNGPDIYSNVNSINNISSVCFGWDYQQWHIWNLLEISFFSSGVHFPNNDANVRWDCGQTC